MECLDIELSGDLKQGRICKEPHGRISQLVIAENTIVMCASAVDAISEYYLCASRIGETKTHVL